LDREIYVPFIDKKDFNINLLINEILKVSQSKSEFLFNGIIEVDFISVEMPIIGGHPAKEEIIDLDHWRKRSNRVVRIKADGLCMSRSIVVSKAYADGIRNQQWRRIREDTMNIQTKMARKLIENAGLTQSKEGNPITCLQKYQNALGNDYQLIAVSPPKEIIFKGNYAEKQVCIQIFNNHADSLLSMKSFLRSNYYCKKCVKGYSTFGKHRCLETCKSSLSDSKCLELKKIQCNDCNRFFMSEDCFKKHKEITKICDKFRYCLNCCKNIEDKNHKCGHMKCKHCKQMIPITSHYCYMSPLNKAALCQEDNLPKVFIFYDFESFQEVCEDGSLLHKPNLCVAQLVCTSCWNSKHKDKVIKYCVFCTGKEICFEGFDAVNKFVDFLFVEFSLEMKRKKISFGLKKAVQIYVVAHNSRAYDIQFILKHCLSVRRNTEVLKRGTKILSMSISNYKFIDSEFYTNASEKITKNIRF
jgi:hypothetical protein